MELERRENPEINEADAEQVELNEENEIKIPSSDEYIEILNEQGLESHAEAYAATVDFAQRVSEAGGNAYLVGGCVRDMLIGKISKDFDIEVHGLEAPVVEELAQGVGKVSEVGKSFGILKITLENGLDLDISLPRRESKIASGHKGFEVNTEPYMGIEDACRRRDFTINSILADPITGEIKDPFHGVEDLRNGVLRITDIETFKDDPLRVLRALQFVGRFGLELDEETEKVLKEMIPQLSELPKERLGEEWRKLLLKSEKPSLGLSLGMNLGILKEIHPEFLPLVKTFQNIEWHMEGDAWVHTLMVVDEASKILKREDVGEDEFLIIMLASLCHDLGKTEATFEDEDGRIVSPKHAKKSEELTKKFLAKIGTDNLTRDKAVKLVADQMTPSFLFIGETVRNKNMDGAIRRLAERIYPATIQELALLAEADFFGRGADKKTKEETMLPQDSFLAGKWIIEKARNLGVEKSRPANLIKGKEWMSMGYPGGKVIGELIRTADDLRDEKGYSREMVLAIIDNIKDPQEALDILTKRVEDKDKGDTVA